jgi:phasin family protein
MPNQKSATKKSPSKTAAAKKAAPAIEAPVSMEPVESAVAAHQETIETVLKAGTQAATKGYEQAIALAQEQVEKASETIFKRYDEVTSLGKDNVDACVLSSTVFAKGVESMGKEFMSIAQSAVEANVATAKALFGAKTVREVIELQTEFSRSRFDSLVAESAKLTELSMTLANDTIEPIQLRLNATVEKLMKPVAA